MRLLPLLVLVLLLSACEGEAPPMAVSVPVDRVLGPEPDPGFARAKAPAMLQFPADHGPHDDYALEWWYLSGNVYTPGGRRFGYQFTLFRIGLRPGAPAADSRWRSNQIYMGHGAITDVAGRASLFCSAPVTRGARLGGRRVAAAGALAGLLVLARSRRAVSACALSRCGRLRDSPQPGGR